LAFLGTPKAHAVWTREPSKLSFQEVVVPERMTMYGSRSKLNVPKEMSSVDIHQAEFPSAMVCWSLATPKLLMGNKIQRNEVIRENQLILEP
jgi:hypothetical protein